MNNLVYGTVDQIARLTAMLAAVPMLAPKFKLYSNDFTPNASTVIGDFTECTFGGYTEETGGFGDVGLDDSDVPVAPKSVVFTADGTSAEFAYGLYVVDSTGALVTACRFEDGPQNFAAAGDQLVGTVLFGLNQGTFTIAVGP